MDLQLQQRLVTNISIRDINYNDVAYTEIIKANEEYTDNRVIISFVSTHTGGMGPAVESVSTSNTSEINWDGITFKKPFKSYIYPGEVITVYVRSGHINLGMSRIFLNSTEVVRATGGAIASYTYTIPEDIVYVGICGITPSGGGLMNLDTITKENAIKFYINDDLFVVERGMNWYDYVDSGLNYYALYFNYIDNISRVYLQSDSYFNSTGNNLYLYNESGTKVQKDDLIIEGHHYTLAP